MLWAGKWLLRNYPNAAIFALGLSMFILPHLHGVAIFYLHVWIKSRIWPAPPLVAEIVERWWIAEHHPAYVATAITITILGSILMVAVAFNWTFAWVRRMKK